MKLIVNGVEQDIVSEPLAPLLHVLRDELDITSPKAGCQQGGCGTCTVLILGAPGSLSAVQAAFYEHYAAQCGFCTPGMIVAATHLIESKDGPLDRGEVLDGLAGHYCRCTGYVKIVDAVLAASHGESTDVDDLPVAAPGEPAVQPKGSPA